MPEIRETHVVWLEKDSFRVEIPRPAAAHVWTEYNHTPPETLLQRIAPATQDGLYLVPKVIE